MRKVARLSAAFLMGIMSVLTGRADSPVPLQYHGGPFLETFEIYPLYYGIWTGSEIDTRQDYLVNLAAYMSGKNAPAFEQPAMKQYGVDQVTVAAAKTASPDAKPGSQPLSRDEVLNIIEANQDNGKLPAFGSHRLIVLFPGLGFSVSGEGGACPETSGACHGSESTSAFWAVVPLGQELLVVAHEIFEASADPGIGTFKGWDEAVDQCENSPNKVTLSSFGNMRISPVTDNTNGGACSTTGYTSLAELQDYGVTNAQFVNDNHTNYAQGLRLYILQAYVLDNGSQFGELRYNAVWRPGNQTEQTLIGVNHDQFVNGYNTLYAQGWRLYTFQSYVLANGTVSYNAVLRAGDVPEQAILGKTYSEFLTDYSTLTSQGWRLYILQTYVKANGELLYNEVWRPGDLSENGSQQATYATIESVYDTLSQGWRLYILQSYVKAGGEVLYNAVWRPGTHAETAVYGRTYSEFRTKYDDLFPKGWRLYILNTYVLPGGDVRYDAVWREGTIDRPL